jgi:hypothetical protein
MTCVGIRDLHHRAGSAYSTLPEQGSPSIARRLCAPEGVCGSGGRPNVGGWVTFDPTGARRVLSRRAPCPLRSSATLRRCT